ncbi:arsenate reductase family protein [Maribacter cobaltidurans]|uniref:Uncharacterized protein n=1 Tax=Maribacter cobaltidurans TaxID=1178778 RepID=A0A223V5S2_9FLAO|nr:hypothetical protein [Maribacter cobaltidurans]ASV30765.1 hypothetical protein CJ263_11355 [Maribacter cobaltidurans]GGD81554.1 hypothetical protein GCM10011412_19150 [Maribacter cobaltidurans]
MGVIAMDKKQITLYYSSENSIGKQINAYIQSSKKKNLAVDVSKTNVTGTQWAELADGLNKEIRDLVAQDHPDFLETYGENQQELDENDWLKILEKEPHLLKNPIAIDGENYIELESAASFKKFMEPDSAGLEKS